MISIPKIKEVTLAALRRIKLVRPAKAKSYWQGIPHHKLVETIMKQCKARGWTVSNCRFTTSKNGTELAGVFDVVLPDVETPRGITFQLGLLTSNNQRRALRLVAGAQVMVCHNGMTRGEIVVRHRLTKEFELEHALEAGLDDYRHSVATLGDEIKDMKKRILKPGEASIALVQAGKLGLMPWSRLGEVVKEYERPSYDYQAPHDSHWALMNAFTVVVKKNPPLHQMQQIEGFRELLSNIDKLCK
jgi:hypothetical protein